MYRVKISNFCPDFDKCRFVEMMNTMFSDIRSIDFQPRYNEKGRLFGFITFESESGYTKLLSMDRFVFDADELRVESGQDRKSMPTSVVSVTVCDEDDAGGDACSGVASAGGFQAVAGGGATGG